METLFNQHLISSLRVFDNQYIDIRTLFVQYFHGLPSFCQVYPLDGEKALRVFRDHFGSLVDHAVHNQWLDARDGKMQFDRMVLVLRNRCIVAIDSHNAEILHEADGAGFAAEVASLLGRCKQRQRRQPLEINLIVQMQGQLGLKGMETRRTNMDLNLFYEDDFAGVDQVIRRRLNKRNDKGIVLLHGLPGTGKTSYLRYLISRIKKRVLFLSPSVAHNLMNPDFIELLVDNPNSVLIIEDAENIIMDRRQNGHSSVSNLLNISDGLLSDFLNVQLICTFNSSLTLIDNALMRKGRLIARYEFGKLPIAKAQRLSDHLGFDTKIAEPMTIAEIANQHEKSELPERVEVIGFRRQASLMN